MFVSCKLTLLTFLVANNLNGFKCSPYYSDFVDYCDNSVSPSVEESFPVPEDYDSSSSPSSYETSPDERSYVSCPKSGLHRRPRPIRISHSSSRPFYFPGIPHYAPPIIINNRSVRPHRTLLSPIGRLIHSFVRTVFPGGYVDNDY